MVCKIPLHLRDRRWKLLGTGQFLQDYIGIGYYGMERDYSFIYDWGFWTLHQVPSFFFTGKIGVLHGKLVGTNSPQVRNLFIRGCNPSWGSLLRGYFFRFGNRVRSLRTMMTGSACWAHPGVLWSHTWGLILSFHSFWFLPIGEGVMGSSVVTRSCRALGAKKLPITRVVPSLVSISLPNKAVGYSGTTGKRWENICPSQQQRSAQWIF